MTDKRYTTSATCVFSIKYHFVWCSKYRKMVLVGAVADRLKQLINEKAIEIGISIEALEIMPEHVHVFVSTDPTEAPQRIVNQLKGYSSRVLRKEFNHLNTSLPSLWSRSYYVGTVGYVSEETVKKYITAQKRRGEK